MENMIVELFVVTLAGLVVVAFGSFYVYRKSGQSEVLAWIFLVGTAAFVLSLGVFAGVSVTENNATRRQECIKMVTESPNFADYTEDQINRTC